jgi:glycosyltransferase involved in cell wall biosynthesis
VPTFSIITPVRNSENFILNCLESVKVQSQDTEHLIQDAESSDSTLDIIGAFCTLNSYVKLVSEPDHGQSDALNKLLDRVSGKYVGWLNSDETYLPGTLRTVEKIFENTNADVVYGDCYFVDENQSLIRLYSNHSFSKILIENLGCFIPSCAVFFRADSLRKFRFDTRLKRCMDWDLYLTVRDLDFEYLRKSLSTFAVHSNQVTSSPESEARDEFALLQNKHGLSRNPAVSKTKLRYRVLRSGLKLLNGNYGRELYFLVKSKRLA